MQPRPPHQTGGGVQVSDTHPGRSKVAVRLWPGFSLSPSLPFYFGWRQGIQDREEKLGLHFIVHSFSAVSAEESGRTGHGGGKS